MKKNQRSEWAFLELQSLRWLIVSKLKLFRTIKQMRAAGLKVSQIARQLGLCGRRIDSDLGLEAFTGILAGGRSTRPICASSAGYRIILAVSQSLCEDGNPTRGK